MKKRGRKSITIPLPTPKKHSNVTKARADPLLFPSDLHAMTPAKQRFLERADAITEPLPFPRGLLKMSNPLFHEYQCLKAALDSLEQLDALPHLLTKIRLHVLRARKAAAKLWWSTQTYKPNKHFTERDQSVIVRLYFDDREKKRDGAVKQVLERKKTRSKESQKKPAPLPDNTEAIVELLVKTKKSFPNDAKRAEEVVAERFRISLSTLRKKFLTPARAAGISTDAKG